MSRLTSIQELVFVCLLEGLIMVRSTNIYVNVGEKIAITCPVDDVESWTFDNLKTKDILALCNGQNTINYNSAIAKRLRITSDCKLQITEVKKEDVGKYICFHPNKIIDGETRHAINIQLRKPPLVKTKNRVFSTGDNSRTLKCEVSGEPNKYKFNKWQHFVNGQHVRSLHGNEDGTLDLSYNNKGDISYEDSGLYICNVTNSIRSENGQLWQTRTVNVTIKDKPFLAKPVQDLYLGQNISTTIVALYLLSSSELSASNVNEGNGSVQKTNCAASTVNTQFHGTPVNVSGYICNVSITETKRVNFKNYSITVCNDCCSNMFHFSIRSPREPDKPNVLRSTPSTIVIKDEKKSFWIWYTIIIIVTTAFIICLIIICWRRKAEKSVSHRSQIVENSNQGGVIENSLYQSASDLTEPQTASGNIETANRSIDRRLTLVNRQTVGYSTVGKEESTRMFDCEEMKYRKERNIRYDNSSHLNYTEVVFDPAETRSKFYIHGADNRTPYADIDLSITADPLTSSDEESVSSPEGNNDFVSLEDVQQWNIHEILN